jgi:hypothetical protein
MIGESGERPPPVLPPVMFHTVVRGTFSILHRNSPQGNLQCSGIAWQGAKLQRLLCDTMLRRRMILRSIPISRQSDFYPFHDKSINQWLSCPNNGMPWTEDDMSEDRAETIFRCNL